MQRAANKIAVVIILLLIGIWFYGCGTGDILDENNQRYQTTVSFSDAEEDEILAIDIVYDQDCDGDGNLTDPETFTDMYANILITSEEDAPGLTMTGYKVSFAGVREVDTVGNVIAPPDMPTTYQGDFSIDIPPNSEVSFWLTCMEIDMKIYMGTFLTAFDNIFRYTVTIRMDFVDEYGQGRDITVKRTLYFGWYNNC
jgi:hypothetical protein